MSHVFTMTPAWKQTLELPALRCSDCGHARMLGLDTGTVACVTSWCSALGVEAPLWRVLDEAGIDDNPAGECRPVHRGRPIPVDHARYLRSR